LVYARKETIHSRKFQENVLPGTWKAQEDIMSKMHSTKFKATAKAGPLSKEELKLIDTYWRAANHLSVGQINFCTIGVKFESKPNGEIRQALRMCHGGLTSATGRNEWLRH
jgi:hypothetical protein